MKGTSVNNCENQYLLGWNIIIVLALNLCIFTVRAANTLCLE